MRDQLFDSRSVNKCGSRTIPSAFSALLGRPPTLSTRQHSEDRFHFSPWSARERQFLPTSGVTSGRILSRARRSYDPADKREAKPRNVTHARRDAGRELETVRSLSGCLRAAVADPTAPSVLLDTQTRSLGFDDNEIDNRASDRTGTLHPDSMADIPARAWCDRDAPGIRCAYPRLRWR